MTSLDIPYLIEYVMDNDQIFKGHTVDFRFV